MEFICYGFVYSNHDLKYQQNRLAITSCRGMTDLAGVSRDVISISEFLTAIASMTAIIYNNMIARCSQTQQRNKIIKVHYLRPSLIVISNLLNNKNVQFYNLTCTRHVNIFS